SGVFFCGAGVCTLTASAIEFDTSVFTFLEEVEQIISANVGASFFAQLQHRQMPGSPRPLHRSRWPPAPAVRRHRRASQGVDRALSTATAGRRRPARPDRPAGALELGLFPDGHDGTVRLKAV